MIHEMIYIQAFQHSVMHSFMSRSEMERIFQIANYSSFVTSVTHMYNHRNTNAIKMFSHTD